MEVLRVEGDRIVDGKGNPVQLRGVGIGGWMNMENFIIGYPGVESSLRRTMAEQLDPEIGTFFFDRLLDYFFAPEDASFLRECGINVVRIPLNYRHFESDDRPFERLEAGFDRLERVVEWCEQNKLYVILDLHAVQGCQNTDWHCDNPTRHGFFWDHPHFQDRFVALWEELATRFAENHAIAGYNVMNEPVTTASRSQFGRPASPRWDLLNGIYRRVVDAIRAVDSDHIIFLEGDLFSNLFEGLDPPFAENLVYSSHNYIPPTFGPGSYPGDYQGRMWNRDTIRDYLLNHQGMQFARRHGVPLWVGEFGCVFNGPQEEIPDRLKALEDEIDVFEELGVHWTLWTYKDVGIMGLVQLDPESLYMQVISPILEAKRLTGVDFWTSWLPAPKTRDGIRYIARYAEQAIGDPEINPEMNEHFLSQAALSGYVGALMQPAFAKRFLGVCMDEMDRILESFSFSRCRINRDLADLLKKYALLPEENREGNEG